MPGFFLDLIQKVESLKNIHKYSKKLVSLHFLVFTYKIFACVNFSHFVCSSYCFVYLLHPPHVFMYHSEKNGDTVWPAFINKMKQNWRFIYFLFQQFPPLNYTCSMLITMIFVLGSVSFLYLLNIVSTLSVLLHTQCIPRYTQDRQTNKVQNTHTHTSS